MPKGIGGLQPRPASLLSIVLCSLVALCFCAIAGAQPATQSRFSRSAEAEIVFQEGLLRYTNKQLPDAETAFRQVLKTDPADAEAYYYLGLAQVDQGKATEAIDSFNQSLRLDPTRLEARAARATAAIRAQQYAVAREDLDALAPVPRWNSLVHYLRGQLAYSEGNLDLAATEFAAAKAAGGTEAEPARFYETLTYLRLKQMVQARQAFAETTIDPMRDPSVAAVSRQLDEALSRQGGTAGGEPARKWSAQLSLSYVYDSNVVQLGQGVQLPGGISNQSDSRIVVQPSGSYSFIQNDKWDIGVEASGYFAYQFDLNTFDIASYQIGPYARYRISENVLANLSYAYNYIEFGHDAYLNRQIVTPSLTISEPNLSKWGPGYTQVYYQFQARQFADEFNSIADKDNLDRDGQVHTLGITQRITLPEIFSGAGNTSMQLDYRFADQETHGADYDGIANQVGVTLFTPLPIWNLKADAGVSYEWDNYRHSNSLDAGGDQRFDTIVNVTAGLTKPLNKNMALRVDYTFTDDDSNVNATGDVDVFSYDRHQFAVRFIYTF